MLLCLANVPGTNGHKYFWLLRAFSTGFWQFSSHFSRIALPFFSPHTTLSSTRRNNLVFLLNGWRENRGLEGAERKGSVKNLFGEGRNGCTNKISRQPYPKCPVLTPGSLPLDRARAAPGRGELRKGDRRLCQQSSLTSLPPWAAFSAPEKGAGSRTRPGDGPPGGDGLPAAGGGGRAHSPVATLIVTCIQLNRSAAFGGAAAAPPPSATGEALRRRESRAAARRLQAGRPRRGRGGRRPRSPGARGGRKGRASRKRGRSWGSAAGGGGGKGGGASGGRGGRGRQEAANATDCLHTSLRLPWLVKEPSGSLRGGRVG